MHATRARRRIGVIGTFVWDVIYGCPPRAERGEGWGGIAYALSGLDAALNDDWDIVPLIKVGSDVAEAAAEFLATLRHIAPDAELVVVPEPNNRSELRYFSDERRSEFLTGGVPAWTWAELGPRLESARLDALYVNFLSGWELDLATMRRVRATVGGPIYVDLHMLLWEAQPSGLRQLRPLRDAAEWYRCFDLVQVNEDEMATLAGDAASFAMDTRASGVPCALVTLGRRGATSIAAEGFTRLADLASTRERMTHRTAFVEHVSTTLAAPRFVHDGPGIDPTGCGDVWGATCMARLVMGDELARAVEAANRAAGRSVQYHGASGLVGYLGQEVSAR